MKRTNNMKRGGSFMPKTLREDVFSDPEYSVCSLKGLGECGGRLTKEHSLIYAGKKIQERFAIISLCASHHNVDEYQDAKTMVKDRNVWVALNRATEEELIRFSKVVDYRREKSRLNEKFGVWTCPDLPSGPIPQKAPILRSRVAKSPVDEMELEARRFARENGLSIEAGREYLAALN